MSRSMLCGRPSGHILGGEVPPVRAAFSIVCVSTLAALIACGGGRPPRRADSYGYVAVDSLSIDLTSARGTVLNTPRAIYYSAGIPMPALIRFDIYNRDEVDASGNPYPQTVPALVMTLGAGPAGDFFAGRATIPVSLELQLGGMRAYASDEALAGCRAWISVSPLDSAVIQLDFNFSFLRGSSSYSGEYSGEVSFPGVAIPPSPPAYPNWAVPDTLFFETDSLSFRPRYFASLEETFGGVSIYTIYAFTDPIEGRPPSKISQTCLRVRIPAELALGQPVPAVAEAYVVNGPDTLSWYAGYAYGWVRAAEQNGVLAGQLQFQGNGSEMATRFRGGGSFAAPIK
jgi:hypothetical protein